MLRAERRWLFLHMTSPSTCTPVSGSCGLFHRCLQYLWPMSSFFPPLTSLSSSPPAWATLTSQFPSHPALVLHLPAPPSQGSERKCIPLSQAAASPAPRGGLRGLALSPPHSCTAVVSFPSLQQATFILPLASAHIPLSGTQSVALLRPAPARHPGPAHPQPCHAAQHSF